MGGRRRSYGPYWLAIFLGLLIAVSGVGLADAAEAASLSRDAQAILASRCFSCHGPDEAESSLALNERGSALAEADSGEFAIVPGKPQQSELIRRISSSDESERMPPEGEPLSAREVALLRQWIAEGANYEKHWAFVPPVERDPPQVQADGWVANPIDAFILSRLEQKGLTPAAPADRRVLARRLYFDITGLPPTPAELQSFLDDQRPDAYERLVDELLASPRYGEKWARHWLDVVRYAESNSFERDAPKPFAWKYRDYVIRSLNDDKPYDQFVREQLAGDELDEVTADSMIATGYYRLGTWDDEPADALQSKYDDLDNIVSTTSQAFLGLTVGCARCHDHKIDPMPQTDYYSLLAFFADVTPYALSKSRGAELNSLFDLSDPDAIDRRKHLTDRQGKVQSSMSKIEKQAIQKMDSTDQVRVQDGERQQVIDEKLEQYTTAPQLQKYVELKRKLKVVTRQLKALPPAELVLSLAKCDPHPETMHVMMRGNPHVLGDEVEPCFPTLFGTELPKLPVAAKDARSAGRRRVLADWITQPDNMLTGRVIVNRVWQHHFGRGIVRSANNFGLIGTPPTHPELLDWLAFYLGDQNWQLKPLHRLILTSNTYRMSSTGSTEGLATDPSNNLFWRFNMRRLTAEEIRDSVLYVSGQLNEKLYGPSIYPKLSQEVLATQSRPGQNWNTSKPREASRRSIYIHVKRSLIPPELAVFDFPETDTSCEARFNTTQAAQALNLMHGAFLQTQARHLATRVVGEVGDDLRSQLARTLSLALGHEPDEETLNDGLTLVGRYRTKHGLDASDSLRQYCLMVLNLNEFVYLD